MIVSYVLCDKCGQVAEEPSPAWDFIDQKTFHLCRTCDELYIDYLGHSFTVGEFEEFSHSFCSDAAIRSKEPPLLLPKIRYEYIQSVGGSYNLSSVATWPDHRKKHWDWKIKI